MIRLLGQRAGKAGGAARFRLVMNFDLKHGCLELPSRRMLIDLLTGTRWDRTGTEQRMG